MQAMPAESAPRAASTTPGAQGRPVATTLTVAFIAALCLLPALWNGFPLVFSDTNGYIGRWDGNFPIQPPYYSFAIWITSRPISLYFSLLLQALIAAYVIYLFFRTVAAVQSTLTIAAYGATIAGLTQLPWVASYIMPDVFGGIAFACVLLLFLTPSGLSRAEWWFVFLTAVFSAIVSTANVLILTALCVGLVIARYALPQGRLPHDRTSRQSVVLCGLTYIALVISLAVLPNRLAYGRWTLHSGSGAMLFNLLLDSGIAQAYLRQNCPRVSQKICSILPALEAINHPQAFLWDGLADKTHAWTDRDGEFARVSHLIMAARPLDVAKLVLQQAAEQFTTISLGAPGSAELQPYAGQNSDVRKSLLHYLPGLYPRFVAARQQRGTIRAYYPATFYLLTTLVGYAALLGLLVPALRAPDRAGSVVLAAGLAFIVLGMVVQGGLVSPQPRYGAKVTWVAWLVAIAVFHRLLFPAVRDGRDLAEPRRAARGDLADDRGSVRPPTWTGDKT